MSTNSGLSQPADQANAVTKVRSPIGEHRYLAHGRNNRREGNDGKRREEPVMKAYKTYVVLAAVGVAVAVLASSFSFADGSGLWGKAPGCFELQQARFKIVDVQFVAKLTGTDARFEQSQPDKYRGIVVTLQVTKPAGEPLTLYAQDFSLHYRFGDGFDVAPCQGISGFSRDHDVDRPMYLSASGRRSSSAGTSTRKASTVYIDLFFDGMEPTTSELHVLLAQPIMSSFTTGGWTFGT